MIPKYGSKRIHEEHTVGTQDIFIYLKSSTIVNSSLYIAAIVQCSKCTRLLILELYALNTTKSMIVHLIKFFMMQNIKLL